MPNQPSLPFMIGFMVLAIVLGWIITKILGAITLVGVLLTLVILGGAVIVLYLLYLGELLPEGMARVFDRLTGNTGKHSKMVGVTAAEVEQKMPTVLLGQPHIVMAFAAMVGVKLRMRQHGGVMFSALVAGDSGTGKTTVGQAVAESLYRSAAALTVIDCTRSKHDGALAELRAFGRNSNIDSERVLLIEHVESALVDAGGEFADALTDLFKDGRINGAKVGERVTVILTTGSLPEATSAVRAAKGDVKAITEAVKRQCIGLNLPQDVVKRLDVATATLPLDEDSTFAVVGTLIVKIVANFGLTMPEKDGAIADEVMWNCADAWTRLHNRGSAEVELWITGKLQESLAAAVDKGASQVVLKWEGDPVDGCGVAEITAYAPPPTVQASAASASGGRVLHPADQQTGGLTPPPQSQRRVI